MKGTPVREEVQLCLMWGFKNSPNQGHPFGLPAMTAPQTLRSWCPRLSAPICQLWPFGAWRGAAHSSEAPAPLALLGLGSCSALQGFLCPCAPPTSRTQQAVPPGCLLMPCECAGVCWCPCREVEGDPMSTGRKQQCWAGPRAGSWAGSRPVARCLLGHCCAHLRC